MDAAQVHVVQAADADVFQTVADVFNPWARVGEVEAHQTFEAWVVYVTGGQKFAVVIEQLGWGIGFFGGDAEVGHWFSVQERVAALQRCLSRRRLRPRRMLRWLSRRQAWRPAPRSLVAKMQHHCSAGHTLEFDCRETGRPHCIGQSLRAREFTDGLG